MGPQKETGQIMNKENVLSTSRSVGRMPLGLRMHQQAEVYKEHKEMLKIQFENQRLYKEKQSAPFQPKLVARLQ